MAEQEPIRKITIINPGTRITTRTAPPDWRPGYVPTIPVAPEKPAQDVVDIRMCEAFAPSDVPKLKHEHFRGSRQARQRDSRPVL